MIGNIFLNYRRADAEAWADRLYERLVVAFRRDNVFMDITGNIPIGLPWAEWLDSRVAACDLMLVLIGRSWVAEFESHSAQAECDFVRVEIERALARKIPVVPVFLGETPRLLPADLPGSIRPLLDLQSTHLHRPTFHTDVEVLIDGIVRSIELTRRNSIDQVRSDRAGEGRIKVNARFIHGAPDGWFQPGAGKTEWFKDLDFSPEMVVVPAGSFLMGSSNGEGTVNERPQHQVTIAQPFAVARNSVTFNEWNAALAQGGVARNPEDSGWGRGHRPVINVAWNDAQTYCNWLSKLTRHTYRLLSEAEWEYACRAGTTTNYTFGETITKPQAQFSEYTLGSAKNTIEIGAFMHNAWGLYDVHGNVWEWCEDCWREDYNTAPVNGSAWNDNFGHDRLLRGGSWYDKRLQLRSASRHRNSPDYRSDTVGFRVCCNLHPIDHKIKDGHN